MSQPKRYLVTGGSGFLGSALVRRLVRDGHRVRVLDNGFRGAMRRLADVARDIEMIEGDIRDASAVDRACRNIDSVCHLAYVNGTELFYTRPDLVLDVGVRGMINVIDAAARNNVGELVLASSSEVYQTPPDVPTGERVPLVVPDVRNPRYSYGAGKLISEVMALHWAARHVPRVVTFRPHNAFGPDMGWGHVIPELSVRLADLADRTNGVIDLPIEGTGKETRAFVYVDDLIEGVINVIDRGENGGIYHVGTCDEVSIATLATEIARTIGRQVRIVTGPLKPGGTMRRCPDISSLRSLGFSPKISLKEGLARTVPWYVEHRQPASAESRAA
jgi:dTDP-glucose 4,6-dehydratase/UDP-glucose 4-epimerase